MPTLAGFIAFIRASMGIPVQKLADTDPAIAGAYAAALEVANDAAALVAPISYGLMVYNLAADNLITMAADQVGTTFFADLRTKYGLNGFVPGIVQSSSDDGTSQSLMVPDSLKGLTLGDLAYLKTPFGQAYLALAQRFGSVWGLS